MSKNPSELNRGCMRKYDEVGERGEEKLPFPAALCFSIFFSRAIFDFCPLPPPMSDTAGRMKP